MPLAIGQILFQSGALVGRHQLGPIGQWLDFGHARRGAAAERYDLLRTHRKGVRGAAGELLRMGTKHVGQGRSLVRQVQRHLAFAGDTWRSTNRISMSGPSRRMASRIRLFDVCRNDCGWAAAQPADQQRRTVILPGHLREPRCGPGSVVHSQWSYSKRWQRLPLSQGFG